MASIEFVQVGGDDPKLKASQEAFALKVIEQQLPEMKLAAVGYLINQNWKNVNFAAKPYLDAIFTLGSVDDLYGQDSGRSIVMYFLGNAQGWRGPVAKLVKAELNRRIK